MRPERSSSQSSGYMTTLWTVDGSRFRSGSGGIGYLPGGWIGYSHDSTPSTC